MKNKMLIFLALFSINQIYGQEENAFSIVNLNFGLSAFLGFSGAGFGGLGYERALNDNISLGISLGYSLSEQWMTNIVSYDPETGITDYFEYKCSSFVLDILPYLRYYPIDPALKGLFIGIEAGYTMLSLTTYYKKIEDSALSHFFTLQAQFGWKIVIKRFFIEPWLGYSLRFGSVNTPAYLDDSENYDDYDLRKNLINISTGLSLGFTF
ncbi:MAG: hypothetical protein LBC27_07675 [Spirochaetaceae bacterium]|jgi:hypothetical protein|nr:hypothetical protein [Spirochaetaceae bacterium]